MIEGEHVRLRKLGRTGLPTLHRWMNDREVMAWARFSPDHMVSLAALEKEYEKELAGEDPEGAAFLGGERGSGRASGWTAGRRGDRRHGSATVGNGVGAKEFWGCG